MNQIVQPNSPIKTFLEIIGLAVLYFATARLGQLLAIPPGNVTPVWLPSGIILAAVLIRGNAVWPGIWLGAFVGNVWAYLDWAEFSNLGASLISGTMNGLGDTLCAVVGAHLILKSTHTNKPFNSSSEVFRFILYGALVGCAISAVLGVTGLSIVGYVPWSDYTHVWVTWWVGDAAGVLLLTPILLMFRQWVVGGLFKQINYREFAIFSLSLVALVGFALELMPQVQLPIPLFMVLPILLWGVFRFPIPVPIFAVVCVSASAIVATALGKGSFAGGSVNASFIELQLFLSTIMSTIFVLVGMVEERRRFEKGVEQSEKRYQKLFDQAAGGILVVDENGCIESFNEKAEDIFGFESSEVVGRNVSYLTPSNVKDSHQGYFDRYDEFKSKEIFGEGRNVIGRHKDGREIPLFLAISETSDQDQRRFLAVIHDISKQVEVENELKASEEMFRLLANSSFEALLIINKGVVVSVNETFQQMFGYEETEIVGKPIKQKLFATDLVFMEGQGGIVQSEGIKKLGTRFPVEVQQKTEIINDETLKIIAVRDRTDFFMQQQELKEARDQAVNASRSKSRFLSAMSHELRTPMNSIVGFSQLLEMNLANLDSQQVESVKEIRTASKHLIGLIDDILDLSKIEAGKFVVNMGRVELDGVVNDCVDLIKPLADKRGIKIFNHIEGSPQQFVSADGFRLKQVF